MKLNLQEKYKNAKNIDFLCDLKTYKGLKSSVIIPYACMLSPIFLTWVAYLFWWLFGINNSFIGFPNTFPLWLLVIGVIIFCFVDIPKIVIYIIDNKQGINPIKRLKDGISTYPEVLFLLLMFIWILISAFINPRSMSIRYETFMQEGIPFYLGYVVIFVFSFLLKEKSLYEKLLIAFLISSTFAGISTIIDPHGNFLLSSHNNTGWAFSMINSNHYGYFLTLSVVCSACMFLNAKSRGIKIFTGFTFLLNSIVLIFNNTLGCLLGVLAVLILIPIFYSIRAKKFQWIYLLPLCVFVCLTFILTPLAPYARPSTYKSLASQIIGLLKDFFSVTSAPLSEEASHAGSERWSLWLQSFEGIKEHPWFGTGDVFFKPHNEYLQHAYNFGILCLVFYLVALVIILVKALKNLRHLSDITLTLLISTLAYLIQAMFGNTMPHTMPFFIIFLALSIRSLNADIQQRNTNATPPKNKTHQTENI